MDLMRKLSFKNIKQNNKFVNQLRPRSFVVKTQEDRDECIEFEIIGQHDWATLIDILHLQQDFVFKKIKKIKK